jgi:hypothetical protein
MRWNGCKRISFETPLTRHRKMKKIDFYGFVGMIAPGGLLIFGLSYFFPGIGILLHGKEISFGDLGLFVILAYVVGHIAQCLGDFIGFVWDWSTSGQPTDYVRKGKEPFAPEWLMRKLPKKIRQFCEAKFEKPFLSPQQLRKLPAKIREVLKIDCQDDLSQVNSNDWFYITRQGYATVKRVGLAGRIDIFNGCFGLMRGVVASLVILLVVAVLYSNPINLQLFEVLGIAICFALLRMHRFGLHYARELFVQLLSVLPGDLEMPAVKEVEE